MTLLIVHFGDQLEFVELRAFAHPYPNASDFYSLNTITAEVVIHVGAFDAQFEATFSTEDFAAFHQSLDGLHKSLAGIAELRPLDKQLVLILEGDKKGHIHIHGEARDRAGNGNHLCFSLETIDQTALHGLSSQLGAVLAGFPVRTAPAV